MRVRIMGYPYRGEDRASAIKEAACGRTFGAGGLADERDYIPPQAFK
jgi:hypothetical protein